jgi:hypothetical protein
MANQELEAAKKRVSILVAELEAMEAEVDEQMKKYAAWPGLDMDQLCEVERGEIKIAALMGENVEGLALKRFEEMGKEILRKQCEVDQARRLAMSYECDEFKDECSNTELLLWHHKGRHYLRNKMNQVYWQKTGRWVGVYLAAEDRIDEDVTEPEYEDNPPPLVSLDYAEWKCDKTQGCLCK